MFQLDSCALATCHSFIAEHLFNRVMLCGWHLTKATQLKYPRHLFQLPHYGATSGRLAQASYYIYYMQTGKRGLLTGNRRRRAAVSQVNSFQLREWISPSWFHCLGCQPIVTKWVDVPLLVWRQLPRKHCQSQANAFLTTLVPKSSQGNTGSPVSLSCEIQWARQPKATCW